MGLGAPEKVEALAAQCNDTGGVYFVRPWPAWARRIGRIRRARLDHRGLTRGSTAAQVARAAQESIAYQVRDVYETMQDEAGMPLQVLLVDGGPTRNQALMQFQADILGVPVLRSLASDVSALGALRHRNSRWGYGLRKRKSLHSPVHMCATSRQWTSAEGAIGGWLDRRHRASLVVM